VTVGPVSGIVSYAPAQPGIMRFTVVRGSPVAGM